MIDQISGSALRNWARRFELAGSGVRIFFSGVFSWACFFSGAGVATGGAVCSTDCVMSYE
jgi:hypothetical protein